MVMGAIVFNGVALGPENFLERWFIDLRFFIAAHLREQDSVSDRIAIVLMDTGSEKALGVPFGTKWRQFHPDLIRTLNDAGASLIVFDAMFYDEDPEYDPALIAAIGKAGNVVAGEDGILSTPRSFRDAFSAIGNLRIPPLGGKPRYVTLDRASPAGLKPLSLVAVEGYAERTGGSGVDPWVTRASGFWIDFRHPFDYFPSFSYADVLKPEEGRLNDLHEGASFPLSVFADRIVFIGRDEGETGRNDRFVFPNSMGRTYPGVYGQAFATDAILGNHPTTRVSPWLDACCTLVSLALLLLILELRARKTRTALLSLLPIAIFVLYAALLAGSGLWLGYAPLFVGFWSVLLLHWALLRISLTASLSRAMGFDPGLIVAFRRERTRSGGHVRKEATILIADVRDYTRYVSRTEPETVSRVMSEYMEAMERCITAEGGYINKYVGDEIIAVFGFPLSADRSTRRAARAAIAMLDELARLVASWKEQGLSSVERIGIGIDTGMVAFAEVGGRTRSQFDIIGDCVNGASRIEHLTKELRRSLLTSEEVFRSLESDDSLSGSFELLKTVAVRGQGERKIFALVR
jgi:class 3 adenylate cyclase/CHASE2 domain-containing sensor protein